MRFLLTTSLLALAACSTGEPKIAVVKEEEPADNPAVGLAWEVLMHLRDNCTWCGEGTLDAIEERLTTLEDEMTPDTPVKAEAHRVNLGTKR